LLFERELKNRIPVIHKPVYYLLYEKLISVLAVSMATVDPSNKLSKVCQGYISNPVNNFAMLLAL
jgi:hypothetical protein